MQRATLTPKQSSLKGINVFPFQTISKMCTLYM